MRINKRKIILILIILAASFLRLFNLSRADMVGDAAHYSFRAVGYLDYLSTTTQTSPLVWFEMRPWWSFLSFHDHPPLVFLIQHLFFKTLGISTFTARLPFALFGIASVFLLYLLVKKLYGPTCACSAALLLAIGNYHVWISRIGFLESILIFFILLTLYYFIKALEKDSYFIHFGICLGLCFLCKYTGFFLVPLVFLHILIWQRRIFLNKKFWLGLGLTLIIFSPVLIYNFKMLQTRGHFDMQFAALFGQDMSDWPIVQRAVVFNLTQSLKDIWQGLKTSFSPALFCLFFVSLAYLFFEFWIKAEKRQKHSLLILFLLFLTVFFVFTKTSLYFISPYVIPVSIIVAYLISSLLGQLDKKQKYWLGAMLCLPGLYILLFSVNTNLVYKTWGSEGKWYSSIRTENYGFKRLEEFLNDKIQIKDKKLSQIITLDDVFLLNSEGLLKTNPEVPDIFIFDENLNWFARTWHFRRRIVYQKVFFMPAQEFLLFKQEGGLAKLAEHYRNFYFIRGVNESLLGPVEYQVPFADMIEEALKELALSPTEIILNYEGEEAFRIYKFE